MYDRGGHKLVEPFADLEGVILRGSPRIFTKSFGVWEFSEFGRIKGVKRVATAPAGVVGFVC